MDQTPRYLVVLSTVVLLAAWAGPAAAQEGEAPAPDPAMAAMMEAMEASMTPGSEHASLAETVGTWNLSMTFWMDPNAPPQTGTGTAERKMILGGRVLEERVTSEMMGAPFEGIGYTGYDNVTGEWWSTWMDNHSTGMMLSKGTWDEETHTSTWKGEMSDPMAGAKTPMKIVVRHEGPDKEVSEFYAPGPEGEKMVKTMEIVYERQ